LARPEPIERQFLDDARAARRIRPNADASAIRFELEQNGARAIALSIENFRTLSSAAT
jgi:hypothetical protein